MNRKKHLSIVIEILFLECSNNHHHAIFLQFQHGHEQIHLRCRRKYHYIYFLKLNILQNKLCSYLT